MGGPSWNCVAAGAEEARRFINRSWCHSHPWIVNAEETEGPDERTCRREDRIVSNHELTLAAGVSILEEGTAIIHIEIHQPELEALIRQRMASGAFQDVEDALLQALRSAPPPLATDESTSGGAEMGLVAAMQAMPKKGELAFEHPGSSHESLVQLIGSVRGLLTDEEVDYLFKRDPSVARSLDLS